MSNFKLKFTKLDKRHRGYGVFTHYVEVKDNSPYATNRLQHECIFNNFRNLCFEIWGMSTERDNYTYLYHNKFYIDSDEKYKFNEYWAWHTEHEQRRIYLTEKGKTWAELAWT